MAKLEQKMEMKKCCRNDDKNQTVDKINTAIKVEYLENENICFYYEVKQRNFVRRC